MNTNYYKRLEADYLEKVEIWWLKAKDWLKPGIDYHTLSWNRNGWAFSIGLRIIIVPNNRFVELLYDLIGPDGKNKQIDTPITLLSTKCNYGGIRYWFECPSCYIRVGVLCWKLDRLARNPIDGGSIIWAIKNNGISIYTPSQQYSQEQENQLLMYVEFGMAQKFIDDLSKNTKRGMNAKAELGWFPQNAPLGYINTPNKKKGMRTIEKDLERFSIVKRCFKEVINGRNAMDVYRDAVETWGLTNTSTDKPIAQSTFYKMLNSPFYFGEFFWNSGKT
jgi:hypothetical protein